MSDSSRAHGDPGVSPKPGPESSIAAKPRRSPVERVIVWGGIAILLVLLAIQGRARLGYAWTLSRLQSRLALDDGPEARPLYAKDVDPLVMGWPLRTTEHVSERLDVVEYSWHGLLSSYSISVHYDPTDAEPAVYEVLTGDAPPKADVSISELRKQMEESPDVTIDMGSQTLEIVQAFHPLQLDANGDGRVSREEGQEQLRELFDQHDADGDGFLSGDELEPVRESFDKRREQEAAERAEAPPP